MIPSIPDKHYKLAILLSIIVIGYAYFTKNDIEKKYFEKIDNYNELLLEDKINEYEINFEKYRLIEFANEISLKYKRDSLIKIDKNDNLIYSYPLNGNELLINDIKLVSNEWNNYKLLLKKSNILELKINSYKKYLDSEEKLKNDYDYINLSLMFIGSVFLFFGIIFWILDNEKPHSIQVENYYKKIKDRIYTYCQSCGKLFSASRNYGTEKDGTESNCYCFECYQKGEFTNSELTKEEFIKNFKEENKQMNIIEKWALIKKLNNLDRWNPNKYFKN